MLLEIHVLFNPLHKITKEEYNTIKKENKATTFIKTERFKALFNTNTVTNLLQATKYGYIDNNIKMTLDALFSVGSVLYLNKQPYAIGYVQWTQGDWKIESLYKEQFIYI